MNEEEIFRKRLLVGGDGTGDERRINLMLRKFMNWTSQNGNEQDVLQTRDNLLSQISQCEYAFLKSRLTASMATAELDNYGNVSSQIEKEIANIKKGILATKEDLKEAKIIRKNRLECEVIIKVIKEQPDRKETNEKLSNLQAEIALLENRYEQLEKKLDMRKKQFHVLFASLHQLQSLLEIDDVDSLAPEDVSMEELDELLKD